MNKEEALNILRPVLTRYRKSSYSDLVGLIGRQETIEVTGASGTRYQVEIEAFRDDKISGNIRILGTIDDGGIRALLPLCQDCIIAPDGSFIDE